MKLKFQVIFVTVFVIFLICLCVNPLILFVIKRQITKVLVGSSVEIENFNISWPFNRIVISGLRIAKNPLYDLKLKELSFEYNLLSLIKGGKIMVDVNEAELKYSKIEITDMIGSAIIQGRDIMVNSLTGSFLGGKLDLKAKINIDRLVSYDFTANLTDIDLKRLVKDFNLERKVGVDGKISGELSSRGTGLQFIGLNGNLIAVAPGGALNIKDAEYLKKIAESSNQSFDIMMERFKNYSYNNGSAVLSLVDGNLVLNIDLEGDTGKRNLQIVLHDFKIM